MNKRRQWLAVILTTALLAGTGPVFGEMDSNTSGKLIDGWTWGSHFSDSEVYIDNSEGVLGTGSMKMEYRSVRRDSTNYLDVYQNVSVTGGKTYRLEFDAKAVNPGGPWVKFDTTATSLTPITQSYDWTSFSMTYKPVTTGNKTLTFGCDTTTEGLWIDNVRFYDIETPSINLIQNGDFEAKGTKTGNEQKQGAVEYMLGSKKTITVDGKLDDWSGIEPTEMKFYSQLLPDDGYKYSSTVRYAYDEKNFYFVLDINDPIHYPMETYWQGDSIQFNLGDARATEPNGTERGVRYDANAGGIWKNRDDFDVYAAAINGRTVYEVAVPWESTTIAKDTDAILFNVAINENHGTGRVSSLEISDGIVLAKDMTKYKKLFLMKNLGDINYCVDYEKEIQGDKESIIVRAFNPGTKAQSIVISSDKLGYKKTVEIGAKKEVVELIPLGKQPSGTSEFTVSLKAGNEEAKETVVINFLYDKETTAKAIARIEKEIVQLKELLDECHKKGISTDYETPAYSLLVRYLEIIKTDDELGIYNRMESYDKALEDIYQKAEASLKAYLAKEKTPLKVPKYISSDTRIEGQSMYATTYDGERYEERPVFFTGFGHLPLIGEYRDRKDTGAAEELPFFSSIGLNTVQLASAMYDVIYPESFGDWFSQVNVIDGKRTYSAWELSSEERASGEYSLKFSQEEPTGNLYTSLVQRIEVKPDTTYVYGLKAKGEAAGNTASSFFNMDGTAMTNRKAISSSKDWTSYDYEYTTGSEQDLIQFTILMGCKTPGVYIDDVYIMEKGTSVNLLDNGNFDTIREFKAWEAELNAEAKEIGLAIRWPIIDKVRAVLQLAEENNILFDWPLGPGHMPWFIKGADPSGAPIITTIQANFPLKSPMQNQVMSLYGRIIANIANEYKCLQSIDVANEPKVWSEEYQDYYGPWWREFLIEKYETVEKLNKAYGENYNYNSFEDIAMPMGAEKTPLYYDWSIFNTKLLTEFLTYLSDAVRSVGSDIIVHTKIIGYFHRNESLEYGTNIEYLAEMRDVNSTDSNANYKENAGKQLYMIMGWYDYMTSVKNAPVWDTELHILPDRNDLLKDELTDEYVSAAIWNGSVHGKSTADIWTWDVHATKAGDNGYRNVYYSSTNFRYLPEEMGKVVEANLDLNRLAYEVTALQNSKRKVALLHSTTSIVYDKDGHVNAAVDAHRDILFSGQKAMFVGDLFPENMHGCDLLVIPNAPNVPKVIVDNIRKYIENGGKVLIIGENSLRRDEYNKPHNAEDIEYIYQNADISSSISDKIHEMNLSEIVLVNAETGDVSDTDVEWVYTEYEDGYLVNVINYNYDKDIELKLMYNGNEVEEVTELRSMEKKSGTFTAKRYEPVMLKFSK